MNQPQVETLDQPDDDITHEIPGTLRAIAVGCVIGVVSTFVAVGGALYLSQRDVALALALGAMSAFWGGLGFGAMFGGTIHLVRHSDEAYSERKLLASESATRTLGIIEVPTARNSHVARRMPEDPRSAQESSQVA